MDISGSVIKWPPRIRIRKKCLRIVNTGYHAPRSKLIVFVSIGTGHISEDRNKYLLSMSDTVIDYKSANAAGR